MLFSIDDIESSETIRTSLQEEHPGFFQLNSSKSLPKVYYVLNNKVLISSSGRQHWVMTIPYIIWGFHSHTHTHFLIFMFSVPVFASCVLLHHVHSVSKAVRRGCYIPSTGVTDGCASYECWEMETTNI